MTSMYANPMHQMRNQVTTLTNSVNAIRDTLQKCGIDASGEDRTEDRVRPIAQSLIEIAISNLRAQVKEDIRKERHLLDVAMTYKCEHAISQAVRDKFEFLTKRCDVLGDKIDEVAEKTTTTTAPSDNRDAGSAPPQAVPLPDVSEIAAELSKDWDRRLEEMRVSARDELEQRAKQTEEELQRRIEDAVSQMSSSLVVRENRSRPSMSEDVVACDEEKKNDDDEQEQEQEHQQETEESSTEMQQPQQQKDQQEEKKEQEQQQRQQPAAVPRKGGGSRPVRARKNATLRL